MQHCIAAGWKKPNSRSRYNRRSWNHLPPFSTLSVTQVLRQRKISQTCRIRARIECWFAGGGCLTVSALAQTQSNPLSDLSANCIVVIPAFVCMLQKSTRPLMYRHLALVLLRAPPPAGHPPASPVQAGTKRNTHTTRFKFRVSGLGFWGLGSEMGLRWDQGPGAALLSRNMRFSLL